MSDALVPVNNANLELPEAWNRGGDVVLAFAEHLDTRWRIAQMLCKSGMIRQNKPEAVMAIQLKAFEMGVPLMQALGGMYFIDGKVALEGHLMDALAIQRCGVTKTIKVSTDETCSLVLHREGWDDLPSEYTVQDAADAGLVSISAGKVTARKSNWQRHRKRMLYWRALSNGLSQIAPDYFGGVYLHDELEQAAGVARMAEGNRSTDTELDALVGTVEGMDADEIDAITKEARDAERAGHVPSGTADNLADLTERAQWDEAREALDEIRSAVLHAGDVQGSLV